ncbi:hypothetical protein K461DRAFT_322696 [Myriangium duriaei CBS 260.36]|uniref:Uncharacterized protein n=1 Tax=Myriangium duriaei CBS 260.36 TaxID=1168546 RepID=A0A9P4IZB4_9PEZI|nr:hypothetical protein K461DRAFT_322696 [Myriangium duriaei CBS 260.36]
MERESLITAESVTPTEALKPSAHAEREATPENASCQVDTDAKLESALKLKSYSSSLHRSGDIVFLAICYITLTTATWVVTCILVYKPMGANHYGVDILNKDNNGYGWIGPTRYHAMYVTSEKWFRATRILSAIVAVLAIPMTMAVCARAAVAIHQQRRLTLRQTMALADSSWNDIPFLIRILFRMSKGSGSLFLILAFFLNVLGGIISPVQQIFLSTVIIKTPTWPDEITFLNDFQDFFPNYNSDLVTVLTRSRMASTGTTDPQLRLWSRNTTCSSFEAINSGENAMPMSCLIAGGQSSLGDMSTLEDPFFCQLNAGYSTGLIRQFTPRINSTAKYENITAEAFSRACDTPMNAFYNHYQNLGGSVSNNGSEWLDNSYSVEVCIPGNASVSPWQPRRTRQDFSEAVYLNISIAQDDMNSSVGTYYRKVTLNTTAGFFELPNYMNGNLPGPLLQDDPNHYCDTACELQGLPPGGIYDHNITRVMKRTDTTSHINAGPLLVVVRGLFGQGSFLDTLSNYSDPHGAAALVCTTLVPFMGLLHNDLGKGDAMNPLSRCLALTDLSSAGVYYLWPFIWNLDDGFDGRRIENAFEAAAFLANEAWMTNPSKSEGSLSVSFDVGVDTQVPHISHTGIIVVSSLLGIYTVALIGTALYCWYVPTWTSKLDAFAMLRLGAAM